MRARRFKVLGLDFSNESSGLGLGVARSERTQSQRKLG